jgi:hypothetical protein
MVHTFIRQTVEIPFIQKCIESVALLALLYLVYIARDPHQAAKEMTNPCTIIPYGPFRETGPWPKMYDVCLGAEEGRREIQAQVNHIKLNTPPGHTIVTSGDFGSDRRLIYVPRLKIVIINPVIVEWSIEMIECHDFIHGMDVIGWRHKWVKVRHLNEHFNETVTVFDRAEEACLIQTCIQL